MLTDEYQKSTDNKPDVIVTLVADCARASEIWQHLFNESRYLPHAPQATSVRIREIEPSPNNLFREKTPPSTHPGLAPKKEPAIQLTFSNPPKKPELGYLLGSDEEDCDVFLGSTDDAISGCMLSISFNENNEVILQSSSINATRVSYSIDGTQVVTRTNFTWIFLPEVQSIHVIVADKIDFWVVLPKHETDQAAYKANCENFRRFADSAAHALSLPNPSSQPSTTLASPTAIPQPTTERPFYLRTAEIGDGGFGVVYKGRSMPDGRAVAVKTFKSKDAWAVEANVLKRLSKTPHDNIVQFIDFGLGATPHLVMGLAPGGNLEEQHKYRPFNIRETALILRQMLDALVYLHVGFNIIHRDIKPANILCDSRAHYRLADFGLAKKGDLLKTFNGTQPWIAPEMFENKPYTSAVDLWGLGMVVARFLTGGRPGGYNGDEGNKWCAAVVAHFEKFKDRPRAGGVREPERKGLNVLVGQHMLKIKPQERDSALGCIKQGKFLWGMLDQVSDDASNTPPREDQTGSFPNAPHLNDTTAPPENGGLTGKVQRSKGKELGSRREGVPEGEDNKSSEGHHPAEEDDSEAETELPGGRTLDTNDWSSLEREFAVKESNSEHEGAHLIASFINRLADTQERLTTSDSEDTWSPNALSALREPSKRVSRGSPAISPTTAIGDGKPSRKRKWSSL